MGRWGSGGRLSPRLPALVSEAPTPRAQKTDPSPLTPPKSQVPAQRRRPRCQGGLLLSMGGRVCVPMVLTARGTVGPQVIETQECWRGGKLMPPGARWVALMATVTTMGNTHVLDTVPSTFFMFILRERESLSRGGADTGERKSQAGSMLSTQSPVWGSSSQTVRS